jgi:hypothetical protein
VTPSQWSQSIMQYEHKGIYYFFQKRGKKWKLVTCYAKPLKLEKVPLPPQVLEEHNLAREKVQSDLSSWTSNTVIVVDTSGSMRESDMWGTKNRYVIRFNTFMSMLQSLPALTQV